MIDTQQKTKQYKNVAVALIRDEEGNVLLVKPSESLLRSKSSSWEFPSNTIVPGATYTETFVADILEVTGCIVEAVSLVSSEKYHTTALHFEYVECKVVCRDVKPRNGNNGEYVWAHPSKIRNMLRRRINRDISSFLGL